ncbi:MAG: DUF3427 domain-containing protein [Actinomycetota bacterium]|nr:DUF3427 domain-containing protein [Actinomycetota bacterium]
MGEPRRGLYETLVTLGLAARLEALDAELHTVRKLASAEAADRIALHLSRQINQALAEVGDADRVRVGMEVARALLDRLGDLAPADADEAPADDGAVLRSVTRRRPDGTPEPIDEPLIPLLDTTLLTNAPGEPALWNQLRSEIDSADRIDVVMAFIRRSGIRPLVDALQRHCAAGRRLRVLTTTYTGSTERAALDELAALGAEVRISYDRSTTRLHAKAWVLHRDSGFSTAYVGSSNLTHSAQVTGLEWNVRISGARNPDVLDKFGAVFDSYWDGDEFVPYDPAHFDDETDRAVGRNPGPHVVLGPEVRPEPFQARLLELIELSRQRGHHHNLLVAATGTGKTVMAALDYASLRAAPGRSRLLYVAHRREILDQAAATFRHALREPGFGELWVAGARPDRFDHVFASIQSLAATDLDHLPPDHFDVVVVDEFHHAAAPTYRRLLDHVRPRELLGLTATPERSDGLDVLRWFDGRIAAELRLWDAIDQHRLVPFMYYGVHDGVDLRDVPWTRGRGYDVDALSNVYTSTDAWARVVVRETGRHVDDPSTMRALGFCVSVDHARFMARHFASNGIAAVAVSGQSPADERQAALDGLRDGRIRVVFSVDLFNEGVDLPTVDTVLLLRPTESPTLFLQQLGRGLRRSPGKAFCTVLDFVGIHRREFRFDRKLRALLGGTRREVERAVRDGFPFLPAGCHLQLDEKSSEIVLASLRDAIPSRWRAQVEELRGLHAAKGDIDLGTYLDEAGLDPEDLYRDGARSWSELREAAGVAVRPAGEHERSLRKGVGRLLHIDDDERIATYRALLDTDNPPDVDTFDARRRRLVHMLVAGVARTVLSSDDTLRAGVELLWRHPQVRAELRELMAVLDERVDHLHGTLPTHPDVPLQVHARYTRDEILAAFAIPTGARVPAWQSGVYEARDANAELFAFTLDKSGGGFSPTTRYRDYALNRDMIHWESQAATREDSATGLRYRNHERDGRSIMLFARLRQDDRAFWFLGPGTYQGHVGEKPMAITWKLAHRLPGDLYTSFAAAVA